jgi:hypothetical protein
MDAEPSKVLATDEDGILETLLVREIDEKTFQG